MRAKSEQFDDLDDLDVKILTALCDDGRLTATALAEKIGLSTSPCWARVKKLEERGIIERYAAVINMRKLGYKNVAFVELTLDRHDDKILDTFGETLSKIPEIDEAHLVTGEYDYLIKVIVRDSDHYEQFLRETLYRIPGIRHSRTTFGLRSLKRALGGVPQASS